MNLGIGYKRTAWNPTEENKNLHGIVKCNDRSQKSGGKFTSPGLILNRLNYIQRNHGDFLIATLHHLTMHKLQILVIYHLPFCLNKETLHFKYLPLFHFLKISHSVQLIMQFRRTA